MGRDVTITFEARAHLFTIETMGFNANRHDVKKGLYRGDSFTVASYDATRHVEIRRDDGDSDEGQCLESNIIALSTIHIEEKCDLHQE